jgi:hypothetical protein
MDLSSTSMAHLRLTLAAAAVAHESAGLVLLLCGLRRRNPHNPPRITWRILEWKPLRRQKEHFLGRGFGLYKNGLHLFLLGTAVHLITLLIAR